MDSDSEKPPAEAKDNSLAFSPYHAKEVHHQVEIARLQEEIKERKLQIEEEIEADYRRYKKKLEQAVEKLQRQCEEIDLRFTTQRDRLESENESFWSRLEDVLKRKMAMANQGADEAGGLLQQAKAEVEELQGELSRLSVLIAKWDAAIDGQHQDIANLDEAGLKRRQELEDRLREIRKECIERKRELDLSDNSLRKDIMDKDDQLCYALNSIHQELVRKKREVEETEQSYIERIETVKSYIIDAKNHTQKLKEELPRRVERLKKDVYELKQHVETPENNEDVVTKNIREATEIRIKESEETLTLKHKALGKLKSDLHRKASELKSILAAFPEKAKETEQNHATRMEELKKKYETMTSQRRIVLEKLDKFSEEVIARLKHACDEKENAAQKSFQNTENKILALTKKYQQQLEALRAEIERLQKIIDHAKKITATEEDDHFRLVGELKSKHEGLIIIVERIKLIERRLQNDAQKELDFLSGVELTNGDTFSQKLKDMSSDRSDLEKELSNLTNTLEMHKDASLRAVEDARASIKQDNDNSATEVEKIFCAIKAIKKEIEDDREKFYREMMALDETMKREKMAFVNEKERLYSLMNMEQQRTQEATLEVKEHIERALSEQEDLFKYRTHQTKATLRDYAKKAAEANNEAAGKVQEVEKKIEYLIHTIREVDRKITTVKESPQGTNAENNKRKRDLQNKLYVINECSRESQTPEGVELLKNQRNTLRTGSQILSKRITTLKEKRNLVDSKSNDEESDTPERLETLLLESKLANLRHENEQLRKQKCKRLSYIYKKSDKETSSSRETNEGIVED